MFDRIYIEERAKAYPLTSEVLKALKRSFEDDGVIPIRHYKDVFNRRNQDIAVQKDSPSLILAVREGSLVYRGAKVCQSFGNEHFYYTSCVMNCLYDCEYCYLQGMYPSANIVVFVNYEDIFDAVRDLLAQFPVYLCISYDSDLLAMESWLGMVHRWAAFVRENKDLTVELRTKSAAFDRISDIEPCDRFVLAWTVSPEDIAKKYEHRAPQTAARLACAARALEKGFPVRLCLDPMLNTRGFEEAYGGLIEQAAALFDMSKLKDVSLGVFRISSEYLASMRRQRPDSAVVNYPYVTRDGVCSLDEARERQMTDFVREKLAKHIAEDRIWI
ncbi:MAG: radical SAM protein [Lachnospiraceae bacterium]|nr:radical SAM protein [Lachnospiraceae bacterium]